MKVEVTFTIVLSFHDTVVIGTPLITVKHSSNVLRVFFSIYFSAISTISGNLFLPNVPTVCIPNFSLILP